MALVVSVTVIGLQAVGIILVIAVLIIPASAARFWTEKLSVMIITAALLGAISGYLGAAISGVIDDMPAGATIGICLSLRIPSGVRATAPARLKLGPLASSGSVPSGTVCVCVCLCVRTRILSVKLSSSSFARCRIPELAVPVH